MTPDIQHLNQWIGRSESACETVSAGLVGRFLATIPLAAPPKDEAPIGIHWCLAPPATAMSELGEDGHPAKGSFLPPVPFERRMWAGGKLQFHSSIQIGEMITRTSTIADIQLKTGKSGDLCFVTVNHTYHANGILRLSERQDIVYKNTSPVRTRLKLPKKADVPISINPSSTLLFRGLS